MSDDSLRAHIGSTLRRRRERARLTQAQLAERVATTQATVARIERGDRAPSVQLLERLFGELGCQVRLALEPLHAETDAAIAAASRLPVARRIEDAGIPEFADTLAPIPHVFTGATAALLQGAPIPADTMQIALARRDCAAFTRWLGRQYGQRWHTHYQVFGYASLDPCGPGEPLWRIMGDITIRVDLGDDLPACLEVRHGDRGYRVVPLVELEIGDTYLARLLRRCRERS